MPLRVLRNNGKVFSAVGMSKPEKTLSEKTIEDKKKKLQKLKQKAASKFKPIPAKILSLINRLGNMLQTASVTPSVTEAKINQLLNQISSMIDSTRPTDDASKDDGKLPKFQGKILADDEAMTISKKASSELRKRKSSTLLDNSVSSKIRRD